jgi:hypothetical protein
MKDIFLPNDSKKSLQTKEIHIKSPKNAQASCTIQKLNLPLHPQTKNKWRDSSAG